MMPYRNVGHRLVVRGLVLGFDETLQRLRFERKRFVDMFNQLCHQAFRAGEDFAQSELFDGTFGHGFTPVLGLPFLVVTLLDTFTEIGVKVPYPRFS